MQIDCLSFLDPAVYRGGGEMITSRLLETGRARGHDIRMSTVRPHRRHLHDRPDRVLLFDVFNHAHSVRSLGAWRCFGDRFLERAVSRAPFVHLTNAYADVCNLAHLPCHGRSAPNCPMKPLDWSRSLLMRDFGDRCFSTVPLVRRLFQQAALNVYLSPLHRRISECVLALEPAPPSAILRPMIDTAVFKNLRQERDIEYLFVGLICEAKGLAAMRERYGGRDLTLIGRLAPGVTLDFGRHIDHLPYGDIPKWMNRAKNFVFLPTWPEPQGRVVAEAALCGCTIIGNENVGALSFDFDLADPAGYVGAEDQFWQAIEEVR